MMKYIVVTGASGFIGKALTTSWLEAGHQVYAVTHSPVRLRDLQGYSNLCVVEASFDSYKTLADQIGHSIDVFYHLAWQGYGTHTQDDIIQFENIRFGMQALHAAIGLQTKSFIFTGSCHQYQKKLDNPHNAYGYLCSVYGAAKTGFAVSARAQAARCGIRFYNTIFSHVFGPGDIAYRSASQLITQLLQGKPLYLARADMLYDWTYIADAVDGLRAVLKSDAKIAEYYIGSRSPKPFSEIVTKVRDCLAPDTPLHFGTYHEDTYIDYKQMNLDALWRDTGFLADFSFEQAIYQTAAWLQLQSGKVQEDCV